jgi:hypothetical protein
MPGPRPASSRHQHTPNILERKIITASPAKLPGNRQTGNDIPV